jgi:hypothetical protein
MGNVLLGKLEDYLIETWKQLIRASHSNTHRKHETV